MKYLFTAFFCTAFNLILSAQSGTLDNNFDEDGKAYLHGEYLLCDAMALQKDGKLIQAGIGTLDGVNGFYLTRFTDDGSLDKTFGNGGRVVTDLPSMQEEILSVALQSDGKIVAAGYVDGVDIALVRYLPGGGVDSSFGANGVVITNIRRYDYLKAMAIQPDDKIVVTGTTKADENDTETSFTIRYNSDGSFDESFGDHGTVLTIHTTPVDIFSIALQPDGKILIGGAYYYTSPAAKLLVTRYMPDGRLDIEFGSNGIATTTAGAGYTSPAAFSLAVQADYKIVGGGEVLSLSTGRTQMLVVRFEKDGKIDQSFGEGNGIVIQSFGTELSETKKVLIQQDNKILAVGSYYDYAVTSFFALARFQPDGILDNTFGENGLVLTDVGEVDNFANSAALQTDGKIVVSGNGYTDKLINPELGGKFALVRYNNDAILPIIYSKFTATQTEATITLNWQTTTELNNSYFAVERSGNAVNYTTVARVNSAATGAAVQDYSYTDKLPLAGTNYYRLKQVDKDGKFSYSKTVSIGYIKPGSIQLFPNPAKDRLTVKGLNAAVASTIAVLDIQGKQMLQFTAKAAAYSFSIASLAPGTYMVRVKDDNDTKVEKFVKQ